ncbi:MAG: SRPBCC family protein [Acidimicrobiales bacterium]
MDDATAHGAIDIEAPPELVYDLVTDVTDLPQWAAETDRCRWLGGATEAVVGVRFRGRNRNKGRRWSTTCKVVAADPARRFGFEVYVLGYQTAEWEYRIEPTETGCRVTESTRRMLPRVIAQSVNRMLGVNDRDAHNQVNIERTLVNLKQYAEAHAATL